MRALSRLFWLLFFVLGLAGLVHLAQAQGNENTPKVLVSVSAEEPTSGAATNKVTGYLELRPNGTLPFYVYVETKAAWPAKTLVKVSADKDGKQPLAEGIVGDPLAAGQRVLVKLTPVTSPNPKATAPSGPVADPKAPPPLPGVAAPSVLYIRLLSAVNEGQLDQQEFKVRLAKPKEYIKAVPAVSAPDPAKGRTISVTLSDSNSKLFRGAPAKARLILREDLIPGLDPTSTKDGTYATVLPPGGKDVKLVAKNLRFAENSTRKGKVLVTLDDYDRAYVFDADFNVDKSIPTEDELKSVRIDCPPFAVPGKPFAARLAVYNDPPPREGQPVKPLFRFHRTEDGEAEVVTRNLTTSRDQAIRFEVGKEGELNFTTRVRDWEVPIDTAEVYGRRKLSFTLEIPELDRDFKKGSTEERLPSPTFETSVMFDDTPPTGVQVFDLYKPLPPKTDDGKLKRKKVREAEAAAAKKEAEKPTPPILRDWKKEDDKVEAYRGTRVQFVVSAVDKESEIESILVYTGPPPLPDGKPAPGGKIYPLKRYLVRGEKEKDKPADPPAWTTIIELPDVKGPFVVNYRITNRAGLMIEDTAEIKLIDHPPPPPKPTTGMIEGKVIQGSSPERPQPGLTVGLFDAGGKLVLSATTDDQGEFVFEEVPPGTYLVFCNKEADSNANGRQPANVKAGEYTEVTLELKR